MNKQNYIGIALEELYRIFDLLNKKYFSNQLPAPIITIQTTKKSNVMGWFTLDKIWKSIEEKDFKDEKHEINISAEFLRRDVSDIVETLQHEICHYYNKLADIVDYHGNYHTKKFKETAEKFGLVCHKDSKIGYGLTERSEQFNEFIKNEIKPNKDSFVYFRSFVLKKKVAERKKNLFKYKCEQCNTEAKAKKDTNLICGNCNSEMVIQEE